MQHCNNESSSSSAPKKKREDRAIYIPQQRRLQLEPYDRDKPGKTKTKRTVEFLGSYGRINDYEFEYKRIEDAQLATSSYQRYGEFIDGGASLVKHVEGPIDSDMSLKKVTSSQIMKADLECIKIDSSIHHSNTASNPRLPHQRRHLLDDHELLLPVSQRDVHWNTIGRSSLPLHTKKILQPRLMKMSHIYKDTEHYNRIDDTQQHRLTTITSDSTSRQLSEDNESYPPILCTQSPLTSDLSGSACHMLKYDDKQLDQETLPLNTYKETQSGHILSPTLVTSQGNHGITTGQSTDDGSFSSLPLDNIEHKAALSNQIQQNYSSIVTDVPSWKAFFYEMTHTFPSSFSRRLLIAMWVSLYREGIQTSGTMNTPSMTLQQQDIHSFDLSDYIDNFNSLMTIEQAFFYIAYLLNFFLQKMKDTHELQKESNPHEAHHFICHLYIILGDLCRYRDLHRYQCLQKAIKAGDIGDKDVHTYCITLYVSSLYWYQLAIHQFPQESRVYNQIADVYSRHSNILGQILMSLRSIVCIFRTHNEDLLTILLERTSNILTTHPVSRTLVLTSKIASLVQSIYSKIGLDQLGTKLDSLLCTLHDDISASISSSLLENLLKAFELIIFMTIETSGLWQEQAIIGDAVDTESKHIQLALEPIDNVPNHQSCMISKQLLTNVSQSTIYTIKDPSYHIISSQISNYYQTFQFYFSELFIDSNRLNVLIHSNERFQLSCIVLSRLTQAVLQEIRSPLSPLLAIVCIVFMWFTSIGLLDYCYSKGVLYVDQTRLEQQNNEQSVVLHTSMTQTEQLNTLILEILKLRQQLSNVLCICMKDITELKDLKNHILQYILPEDHCLEGCVPIPLQFCLYSIIDSTLPLSSPLYATFTGPSCSGACLSSSEMNNRMIMNMGQFVPSTDTSCVFLNDNDSIHHYPLKKTSEHLSSNPIIDTNDLSTIQSNSTIELSDKDDIPNVLMHKKEEEEEEEEVTYVKQGDSLQILRHPTTPFDLNVEDQSSLVLNVSDNESSICHQESVIHQKVFNSTDSNYRPLKIDSPTNNNVSLLMRQHSHIQSTLECPTHQLSLVRLSRLLIIAGTFPEFQYLLLQMLSQTHETQDILSHQIVQHPDIEHIPLPCFPNKQQQQQLLQEPILMDCIQSTELDVSSLEQELLPSETRGLLKVNFDTIDKHKDTSQLDKLSLKKDRKLGHQRYLPHQGFHDSQCSVGSLYPKKKSTQQAEARLFPVDITPVHHSRRYHQPSIIGQPRTPLNKELLHSSQTMTILPSNNTSEEIESSQLMTLDITFNRPSVVVSTPSHIFSPFSKPIHSLSVLPAQPMASFKKGTLVVIDGSNVALRHGTSKEKKFSSIGIQLALDYYLKRHFNTIAFVPDNVINYKAVGENKRTHRAGFKTTAPKIPDDVQLLRELLHQGLLITTPPQDYDDSYIVQYAMNHNGYIVSNDRYRDNKATETKKKWLRHHLISFTFISNEFMPNPDFVFLDDTEDIK